MYVNFDIYHGVFCHLDLRFVVHGAVQKVLQNRCIVYFKQRHCIIDGLVLSRTFNSVFNAI